MAKQTEIAKLYRAATKADDHYSAELRRVYGNNAGTARYAWTHKDVAVLAAMQAKLAADKALWSAQCAAGFATNY